MSRTHISIAGLLYLFLGSAAMVGLMSMTPGSGTDVVDLANTDHTVRVDVQALDENDGYLRDAQVLIDHGDSVLGQFNVADRARVSFDLDLGGLYGITVTCPGFFKKRFILDARSDDPSKIHAGPFSAQVNLMSTATVGEVETDLFEMPYAMVVYSKNDHAFVVDQDYLRQTKQLEAALMLKVARAQRQTGGHDK